MRWGYGRVSSKGQRLYGMSLEDQLEKLLAQGIDQEHILLDTYTGTKIDRPKFNEVLSKLKPGDELVVCKLDRFARTAPEGAMLVRDLVERGMTLLPALFAGAFLAHHRFVKRDVIDNIYARMNHKDELIAALVEMYNDPLLSLLDEPEQEGNEGNLNWKTGW